MNELIIECVRNGLTIEEAEKSWYANTPEAPAIMNDVTTNLLAALNKK